MDNIVKEIIEDEKSRTTTVKKEQANREFASSIRQDKEKIEISFQNNNCHHHV